MIQISSLNKGYAHQALLENIGFTVHKGEKIGLVGRNGSGKTTLLRLFAGIETPDSGTIRFPKGYRIAYLQQEIRFSHGTVLDECLSSLPKGETKESYKAEKLLFGLDFTKEMLLMHPSELSGGWQNRLSLAKTLITDADMLLLDEPTNHLDLPTLAWLTEFLRSWRKEMVLITHDRFFMDKVVTHTMAIHRKNLKKIKGGVEKIYDQIATEEEVHEKTRLNDEKERERAELFISRFRAKARLGGLVQSRIKSLAKREKLDQLEQIEDVAFHFHFKPFETRHMMNIENLSFGYSPDAPLVQGLSFRVDKGDRIAFIGRSGKGKTTLLRLIAGHMDAWKGEVKSHPLLISSYYGQQAERTLHPNHTIEEEITLSTDPRDPRLARTVAGGMLFDGPMALKKIEVLSGGEKARVQLGKIIVRPTHCLLLDEPSNHLDMQSTDSLIEAMDAFPGAIVFVSHNEMILHALANKLIIFDEGGKPYYFEGGYQDFLDRRGFSDAPKLQTDAKSQNQRESRKDRAIQLKERRTLLKPLEDAVSEAEILVQKQEQRKLQIHAELVEASSKGFGDKIAALGKELSTLEASIEASYHALFEAHEKLERVQKDID